MEVTLCGVRGSIATPSPQTGFYGGNTACLSIRAENGTRIFLDAGTGLREAGTRLPDSGEAHVFISHGHADHVIGLWFFKPLHSPGWTTHLYLPEWLEPLPEYFTLCGFFPVPLHQLAGRTVRHLVSAGDRIVLTRGKAPVFVEAFPTCHPGGNLGYRVTADNAVVLYTGDHEITGDAGAKEAAERMLLGADLAVVDAQYDRAGYQPGFGHSAWEDWIDAARRAGVGRLVLSHLDPGRTDADLGKLDNLLQEREQTWGLPVRVGREGLRFTLGTGGLARRNDDRLLEFFGEIAGYRDQNILLDRILAKAREITRADAGTIFLVEGDELVFAYTHNDSLFSADEAHRHAYAAMRLPVSEQSIAGYVASTGRSLNLPDARSLPPGAPYRFNDAFDRKTGFVTRSVLTLPFPDSRGNTIGVLQLINSLDPFDATPRAFTADMERDVRIVAREVSGILERNTVEKNGIYGILRMAAVHDPSETGPHAERVGAVAAELYHAWALGRGYAPDRIRYEKGHLRLAAMLHDIGKVGVSDLVLKKPGRLSDEEFIVMRGHTELGASILAEGPGETATLARDIALHHHQKWNGKGYAGSGEEGQLSGEDIPLGARITAIADVFDALVSPRCYKSPWSFEKAEEILRQDAGTHFDPELVARFTEIMDTVRLIYARFPDERAGKSEE